MSDDLKNEHLIIKRHPTNLDLLREQSRQAIILDSLRDDIREIKEVLVGSDKRQGLVMDVDRLKRSRTLFHAVVWVVFTSMVGTAATVIAANISH